MKRNVFYFDFKKLETRKIIKFWLVGLSFAYVAGMNGQGWLKIYPELRDVHAFTKTKDEMFLCAVSSGGMVDTIGLIKIDENGDIILETQYVLPNDSFYLEGLSSVDDGTFFLMGETDWKPNFFSTAHLPTIVKLDSSLSSIWKKQIFLDSQLVFAKPFTTTTTENGDIVVSGVVAPLNDNFGAFLVKLNSQGDLKWYKTFPTLTGVVGGTTHIAHIFLEGGNIGLLTSNGIDINLIKTDSMGDVIWDKTFNDTSAWITTLSMLKDTEGNLLCVGRKEYPNPEPSIPYAIKISPDGDKIWEHEYDDMPISSFSSAVVAQNGGYYLGGITQDQAGNLNMLLAKMNSLGTLAWRREYDFSDYEYPSAIFQFPDRSIRIVGGIGNSIEAFIAKTDSLGNLYTSAITGRIDYDFDLDCQPDPVDFTLPGWLVTANGVQSFATLTDTIASYLIPLDTGTYEVSVIPPGPYYQMCPASVTVDMDNFNDTAEVNFVIQIITECPYLEVSITAPFLRRCFDNTYYVHYCNNGTATADDAYAEVTLDPQMTYLSSTIPLANQNGNTLSFNLGEVSVGECGDFQITAHLDCDSTVLGQTHCTEAHIFPDSLCLPTAPGWDGSSIEVDAVCTGDSVTFILTNTGTGGMSSPLNYLIIEDQIVLMSNEFQLEPSESVSITLPSNGATIHLEAQQSPDHPGGMESLGATVEGCGGWLNIGFFNQYSTPDADPFVDIDCQQNVGSYDPNDKQAFPAGFGDEHLIEPQDDIEYLIRFQNTGTDTAFKVVVVDVLPKELDLATVRPGAASHPYTYGVTPEGWLTFTFDNIELPDSTANEAASHGFVRFRVSQQAGNGWGNVIANTALIYFDINEAVQTNTYVHRVGQIFPWTTVGTTQPVAPKVAVRITPNPLTDSALLEVSGSQPGEHRLTITNVNGAVVKVTEAASPRFEMHRGELSPGLYFFKIERNGVFVVSGKLVIN